MKMTKRSSFGWVMLVAIFSLVAVGCSSTYKTREAKPSGFLGDYSELEKGSNDEAQLVYINPKADFSAYNKIVMDPIKVYANEEGALKKIPKDELQNILNYLQAAIQEQLKPDYTFVDAPGAGVMRLRVALTEAKGSQVVLDTVSSVIPIGMALNMVKQAATGTSLSVGEAGAELELLDSQTGQRLAAAVDERTGSKYTGKFDKFDKYHTIEDACDYWAHQIKIRLAELRTR